MLPAVRVIPVIDLLAGQVVRGIAGRREEYRPIRSQLVPGSDPVEIARALVERFGFSVGYLADLDAIGGAEPAWDTYQAIAATGLRLMVDLGLRDFATAERLHALLQPGSLAAAVVGLESLPTIDHLRRFLGLLGPGQVVLSLDMHGGRPITQVPEWTECSPASIASAAISLGVRRLLLLDLARVGMGEGLGTEQLAAELRRGHPEVELIGGGGIRGPADLRELAVSGYSAILVASALHDGRLTPDDVQNIAANRPYAVDRAPRA